MCTLREEMELLPAEGKGTNSAAWEEGDTTHFNAAPAAFSASRLQLLLVNFP